MQVRTQVDSTIILITPQISVHNETKTRKPCLFLFFNLLTAIFVTYICHQKGRGKRFLMYI